MRAIASFISIAALVVVTTAHADGPAAVEVVRSQFTDKVESSNPVASADQLAGASRVTYWVSVKNTKEPTQITFVWKLDGKESGRQTLDVGTSPSWKTWGTHATLGAKSIEVDVLDQSGATLKTDNVSL